MTDFQWYADEHARRVHALIKEHLAKMTDQMFPGYELSHMGINRNNNTEEVQLVLHLNPLGRVRVVPERPLQVDANHRLL